MFAHLSIFSLFSNMRKEWSAIDVIDIKEITFPKGLKKKSPKRRLFLNI